MLGGNKRIHRREGELVRDPGEFRAGLYDRDIHELRATLSTILKKLNVVIDNQVRLDETLRKVGMMAERSARVVEKTAEAVSKLEQKTDQVAAKLYDLTQIVEGNKGSIGEVIIEKLDETVNQIVASQQDIVGQLRRVSESVVAAGRDGAKPEPGINESESLNVSELAEELRRVIPMVVGGETAKAAESLTNVYRRIEAASLSTTGEETTRKRAAKLRSNCNGVRDKENQDTSPSSG